MSAVRDDPLAIRFAGPADAALVHRFIGALAAYEREPDAVEVDVATLADQLGDPDPPFECLIAEWRGEPAGFAVFFHSYSTWRGRRGLYLEDLFVQPAHRRRGIGRALLRRLAGLAVERGCARFEWAVLDWNTPAHDFYRTLGAAPLDAWTTWRLDGPALAALAAEADAEDREAGAG